MPLVTYAKQLVALDVPAVKGFRRGERRAAAPTLRTMRTSLCTARKSFKKALK